VALFFTGRQLAGESLEELLQERLKRLARHPDVRRALAHLPAELITIVAHCLAHARRYFVDIVDNFPAECRTVLEALREVYRHDAEARELKLDAEGRLKLHQQKSGPPMKE